MRSKLATEETRRGLAATRALSEDTKTHLSRRGSRARWYVVAYQVCLGCPSARGQPLYISQAPARSRPTTLRRG